MFVVPQVAARLRGEPPFPSSAPGLKGVRKGSCPSCVTAQVITEEETET